MCRLTNNDAAGPIVTEQDCVVGLPRPADAAQTSALAAIYTLFVQHRRWPTFDELDLYQDRRGEPNSEAVLLSMARGLVTGVSAASRPIRADQPIGLTVAGLAACDAEDVGIFLQLLHLATEMEAERRADQPATLRRSDASERAHLPAAGRNELLTRASWVLEAEPWGWTMFNQPSESGDWSFTLDRRVRRFRDVSTIEDYWDEAHGGDRAESAEVSPGGQPESAADVVRSASSPQIEVAALHTLVWQAAQAQWEAGHRHEAVLAAAKAVNSHLQTKIGRRDVSEADLVRQAFSEKPPEADKKRLRFTSIADEQTRKSMRQGVMDFGAGCFAAIRNPLGHLPNDEVELGEQTALERLAALSLLARWIDEANVESA